MTHFPDPPEPGIYPDIPDGAYHRHGSVSKSTLKLLVDGTPLECRNYMEHGINETDAVNQGTAVELAVLDPDRFEREVVVRPAFSGADAPPEFRGEGARARVAEWKEANAGKLQIPQSAYDRAVAAGAMARSKKGPKTALRAGTIQLSLLWPDDETELWCRARPDFALLEGEPDRRVFVDIKVSSGAAGADPLSDKAIRTHLIDKGAAMQAAMFTEGYFRITGEPAPTCYLLVVSGSGPLDMRLVHVGNDWLEYGEVSFRRAIRRFAKCSETNTWPGYAEQGVTSVNFPDWLRNQTEARANENDAQGGAR